MAINVMTIIRKDIAVFRTVVSAQVEVTDTVLTGIWRWFGDVEINVPLPVMDLTEHKRRYLAANVLAELDDVFAQLEVIAENQADDDDTDLSQTPLGQQADALWKELAGCYASLVNEEIPALSSEDQEEIGRQMVSSIARGMGVDEDDAFKIIRKDSKLRMMLRMAGVNPDTLNW